MRVIFIGIIAITAGLYFLGSFLGDKAQVEKMTLMAGHNVKITKDCFGALSQAAYDKLVNYTSTQNVSAAEQMRMSGQFVVLKAGDTAELEDVTTGRVKMKMTSGLFKGRSIYTYREMVEKTDIIKTTEIPATQAGKKDLLAYDNKGKFNLSTVSRNDVTDQQRIKYKEWSRVLSTKIANYPPLDARALQIMNDFKAGKISKSSRAMVNSTWEEMDIVRVSLLKFDSIKGFNPAIDDELSRMISDYKGGINDRMAGLWRIVMYCDGDIKLEETKAEVDACLKTSNNFFANYESRNKGFQRIFEE